LLLKQKQLGMFDTGEWWADHWQGMPEFVQEDLQPEQTLLVHFKSEEDRLAFAELVNQKITHATKYIWYPEVKNEDLLACKVTDE